VGCADREFYSTFCFAKRWSQKATTPGRGPGRAFKVAARPARARSTGFRDGRARADPGSGPGRTPTARDIGTVGACGGWGAVTYLG